MSPRTTTARKQERERLEELLEFDRQQEHIVVGIDEVGRGCLAGPVVAAAAILPEIKKNSELAKSLQKLDDSKAISAANREAISEVLRSCCRFAIAEASVEEIDEINILHASLLAMKRAVRQLRPGRDQVIVLVDGNKKIPSVSYRQKAIINGDATSAAIAAASVIAKVHRDKLMRDLALEHPEYAWDSNKGYGSAVHRTAILNFGLTRHHRRKFCEGLAELLPQQLDLFDEECNQKVLAASSISD